MLLLRSILFASGQWIAALLIGTLGLFSTPLPFRTRYRFITLWNRFVIWWVAKTCGLTYVIEGLENIPDEPAVVLAKHQSAWETILLPLVFRPQAWVMKRELLWLPFFGWGLALLEPIAIDRKAGRRAALQVIEQGRKRLQDRRWVVIFPEGTRVPPGESRPFLPGGAALAARARRPIVPVAHNSGDFWPRNSFLKRPGTIRMVIGPPIDTDGRRTAELNAEVETWITSTVERLRRSHPGHAPNPGAAPEAARGEAD